MNIGRYIGVVTLAALVTAPNSAHAQARRWQRQVLEKLRRAVSALSGRGFTASGEPQVGILLAQESDSFAATLEAGRSYALVGVCDDDCSVLELELYGAGENQVAAERATNVPIVSVTPPRTLRYRVKVRMSVCRLNPCWYGLAVQTQQPLRLRQSGAIRGTERLAILVRSSQ